MKTRRNIGAAALAAIITASSFMLSTATASAAPESVSASASTMVVATSVSKEAGVQNVIICWIDISGPGTSPSGLIATVAQVTCTSWVNRISGSVLLYREGAFVNSASNSSWFTSSFVVGVTTACVNGVYYAYGSANIFFGITYTPMTGDIGIWSPLNNITC